MKHGSPFLCALIVAPALALAPVVSAAPPAPPPESKLPAKNAAAPIGLKTFMEAAASSNLLEIKSSTLVARATVDEKVAAFARQMIEEHTKATEKLKKLAEDQGVVLDDALLARHEVMLNDLKKISPGAGLHREYRRMQIAAHEESVALFESASRNLKEDKVKRFAEDMLPRLRAHLEKARKLPEPKAPAAVQTPPKD